MSPEVRLYRGGGRWIAIVVAVLMVTVIGSGCSSTGADPADAWVRSYLEPPDRVWEAIHLTLDDLGYEVEKEDRQEGTVRAAAVAGKSFQGVVLKIDQMMRTDIVRVNVHAGGGASSQPDLGKYDRAANEFLNLLDIKLNGWSQHREPS